MTLMRNTEAVPFLKPMMTAIKKQVTRKQQWRSHDPDPPRWMQKTLPEPDGKLRDN